MGPSVYNKKYLKSLLLAIPLLAAIGLNYFYTKDKQFLYSLPMFSIWAANFFLAFALIVINFTKADLRQFMLSLSANIKSVLLIGAGALFIRLLLISTYPYVTIADEIRDAGINALGIKKGALDLFGFGTYEGYGNFIPLISYFFMQVFGISRLIYTFPSAIAGTISVVVTYIAALSIMDKRTALFSSLFLTLSCFHLHYSRTELLVIMDALICPLIIITAIAATKHIIAFGLLGLASGLSVHFYVATRGFVLASILFSLASLAINCLSAKSQKDLWVNFGKAILGIYLLATTAIIAAGPTILSFLSKNGKNLTKIGNHQVIWQNDIFRSLSITGKIWQLTQTYAKSVSAYLFTPAIDNHFHFNYPSPLLSFPLNIFFIIGLIIIIKKTFNARNIGFAYIIAIILIFPITNQVIISEPAANHRLMGIVPTLSIVSAYGLVYLTNKLKPSIAKKALIFFLMLFIPFSLYKYFVIRPSDYRFLISGAKEYALQEAVNYLQENEIGKTVYIHDDNGFYNPKHYEEKITFFLPEKTVIIANGKDFLSALETANRKPKESTFVAFNNIPEITRFPFKKIIKKCDAKIIIPNYECPIGKQGYSIYIY